MNTVTDFRYGFGDEVQDKITGFTGIIVGRPQWIHGCNTYSVRARELKEGVPHDNILFDEPALEIVQIQALDFAQPEKPGGPCQPVARPGF